MGLKEKPKEFQDKLMILLQKTHDIFEKHKIQYFLDFGTLLGFHRENGIIHFDKDTDIGMFAEDLTLELLYDLKKYFSSIVPKDMFYTYHELVDNMNSDKFVKFKDIKLRIKDEKYKVFLDIFLYSKFNNDSITPYAHGTQYFRQDNKLHQNFIKHKSGFYIPEKTEEYLKNYYGPMWMIPDHTFKHENNKNYYGRVKSTEIGEFRYNFKRNKLKHFKLLNTKEWNDFYKNNNITEEPSDFAKYVINFIKEGNSIIDLGCGNGRDSLFFSKKNLKVFSCDLSEEGLNNINKKDSRIKTYKKDFSELNSLLSKDAIYSRWTLHSINKNQEHELFKRIRKYAIKDSYLFIEVRSIKDPNATIGTKISDNEYINGHYRRFHDIDELRKKIEIMNFKILECYEEFGLSKTKNDDPKLIRIIAKRK